MRKKKIQILLSAAAFLFLMGGTMPSVAQERKIGRVERRADRNFIRQKFDKAMAQYETAIRREKMRPVRLRFISKQRVCISW